MIITSATNTVRIDFELNFKELTFCLKQYYVAFYCELKGLNGIAYLLLIVFFGFFNAKAFQKYYLNNALRSH